MVEIANIREQCSWVHKDMLTGTQKAVILAKAAVAKVNLNTPLTPGESPVTKRALVIGGGIAGIQTALRQPFCGKWLRAFSASMSRRQCPKAYFRQRRSL